MLITLGTTRAPATDLGYLLHKHPDRAQAFDVAMGTAHVFYPEATDQRCTVALLLEVDPVGLVRGGHGEGFALAQYVNDRPYAASSLLAVALRRVFGTAMSGRCALRPELPEVALPLRVEVPALACRGGVELADRLFGPLGWQVQATPIPLDETIPAWGDSRYVDLRLTGELRLAEALNHLYVLLPVLDGTKHYWVSPDEVDKLLRAGEGWLATHPERELVSRRYLAHQPTLTRAALARLAEVDDTEPEQIDDAVPEENDAVPVENGDPVAAADAATDAPQEQLARASAGAEPARSAGAGTCEDEPPDRPVPLREQRVGAVLAVLRAAGARRVADLGCGEGFLVAALLADREFTEVLATDVSARALEIAARRLRLDRMPEQQRARVQVFQSSLVYRDERLRGLDAAVLSEVIEHVDPPRLPALERAVFGAAAPALVVVTTPNAEHNVRYPFLEPGAFRHRDHRFEWTRAQFQSWAHGVAGEHGYAVRFLPVGTDDAEVGSPTQLAVFERSPR